MIAGMLVENLEESLIDQCRVYDSIVASGGVLNINIASWILSYAKQSHSCYQECLKQKREKARNEEKKDKKRNTAAEQIKVLKEKDLNSKKQDNKNLEISTGSFLNSKCLESK